MNVYGLLKEYGGIFFFEGSKQYIINTLNIRNAAAAIILYIFTLYR